MQKMGKEILMVNKELLIVVLAAFLVAILPASLLASVKGPCANCHTMHNSQDGSSQVFAGEGAMWNGGTNTFQGGTDTTPQVNLLKTDCVGCHSSTGADPFIGLGGDAYVPIVWNTAYPTGNELAGGNFAEVANGNDGFGHNVYGVGPAAEWTDGVLGVAPGDQASCGASSCHASLGLATSTDGAFSNTYNHNGCLGCHLVAGLNGGAHHNPNDNSYRMLRGHLSASASNPQPVIGVEDVSTSGSAGWEANHSASRHNVYLNVLPDYTGTLDELPIGRFCSGCHGVFHAMGQDDMMWANINKGDTNVTPLDNPWLRHPNDVVIPLGQHDYPVAGVDDYDPDLPVGQDPGGVGYDKLSAGDQVICLSCHRAHASDQPDALRWDYANQNAHSSPGNNDTTGCFYCHRSKDDTT